MWNEFFFSAPQLKRDPLGGSELTQLQGPMSKLLTLVGATLGGAIGWWLRAGVGIMTAFIVSVARAGAGIDAGRRIAEGVLG